MLTLMHYPTDTEPNGYMAVAHGRARFAPGGGLHLITHAAPPPGVRETGAGGQRTTPTTWLPPGLPARPVVLARLAASCLFLLWDFVPVLLG